MAAPRGGYVRRMHAGLSIAIVILPVLWLLPAAALVALVRFESRRGGGPSPWLHAALNAAFIAWCVYAVVVLREGLHGPNQPLITVPRLLVLAGFYAFVLPQAVEEMSASLRVVRSWATGCHAVAFAVLGAVWLAR